MGGRSVQIVCDWLFFYVGDFFLDDFLFWEYVFYFCFIGFLVQKFFDFWQQLKQICGKNKVYNIFFYIIFCQFFMCEDSKVDVLGEVLQIMVSCWKCKFLVLLFLEFYMLFNFIGFFVKEDSVEVFKKFVVDFVVEVVFKIEVYVEFYKKQLYVILVYYF